MWRYAVRRLFFTVMGFNCLGDGLRDALNPRLRAKAAE
jgi:ABC-type dipeptide/oligopeptide/nickel transport system permease subunit